MPIRRFAAFRSLGRMVLYSSLTRHKGPNTASMLGLSSLHLLEAAITSVFLLPPLL